MSIKQEKISAKDIVEMVGVGIVVFVCAYIAFIGSHLGWW
jgi:hypothetical protein